MKISKDLPPNYPDILKAIPEIEDTSNFHPIFCWGDTVYNVQKELRKDLEIHEATHSKQQGDNPRAWWIKYLEDKSFRLEQEIEAYSNQYIFIKVFLHGKLLKAALDSLAHDLISPIYGATMSHNEAVSKIRNYGKEKKN